MDSSLCAQKNKIKINWVLYEIYRAGLLVFCDGGGKEIGDVMFRAPIGQQSGGEE